MKPLSDSLSNLRADNASAKAHALDETIQGILKRQDHKDRHFRWSAYALLIIIALIASAGIYRQNQIANENNQHLACIVSFFTQSDRANKSITNVDACTVKVDP